MRPVIFLIKKSLRPVIFDVQKSTLTVLTGPVSDRFCRLPKKKEVQKYKYLQESKKYLRALSDFLLQKKLEMPRNMAAQRAG